jgi:50S ribosomal subunit-associated GTPase HflX
LILHVSDATSPILPEQDAQVMEVLRELGADRKPRIHVMNKVDLLEPRQRESLIDTPLRSLSGGRDVKRISVDQRESAAHGVDFGTRNSEPGTGFRNSELGTSPVVHISASTGQGLTALLEHIDAILQDDPLRRVHLRIPQSEGKVLSQLEAGARIYTRTYKDGAVDLDVQAPESLVRRVREWVVS